MDPFSFRLTRLLALTLFGETHVRARPRYAKAFSVVVKSMICVATRGHRRRRRCDIKTETTMSPP